MRKTYLLQEKENEAMAMGLDLHEHARRDEDAAPEQQSQLEAPAARSEQQAAFNLTVWTR